ncbi:hypothetical protein [uncultured Aureimonas sp.]|uniref:hypothetical protein n=1 Tax=uncultured Aureimonas sp. TaxID=1604662 RepID=UPI0025D1F1A3|nr:hypothetical protein [uncultured Aureimonas sp.]
MSLKVPVQKLVPSRGFARRAEIGPDRYDLIGRLVAAYLGYPADACLLLAPGPLHAKTSTDRSQIGGDLDLVLGSAGSFGLSRPGTEEHGKKHREQADHL